MKNKDYSSLALWILALVSVGFSIGSLTKNEINTWYIFLNHSALTPPNYVFPIAWTILYVMIAICGWMIWQATPFLGLQSIKSLYVIQLILNWSWTPLFFYCHLTGVSLVVLAVMNITVGAVIYLTYPKIRKVALLMALYLLWILFASYLNFYTWRYN